MKSSQDYVKFVIGCWTRLRTTSVYTKEMKCQSDHGVQGPMLEKWWYDNFSMKIFGGEEKMRKKEEDEYGQAWIFFLKLPSLDMY